MTECYLLCNVTKCRKELKIQAWVTFCSHIFCIEHGQIAVDKEKCLACDTLFSNKYDIVVIELNPTEQYKNMVLAGLSPEKVLDIANRSLTFWTYQFHQERMYRDSVARTNKEHSAEMADYCESLIAKHKMEFQKLHREIQSYQKELAEKSKQMQDIILQLTDKTKLIKNLQSQNESFKRMLANYKQSHEKYLSHQYTETGEDNMPKPYIDFHQFNQDERNNGHYSYQNENKDFVFKPMTSNYSKNNKHNFQ